MVDKTVARIEKKNRWKVRLEERYAKIKAKKAASVKVDRKVDGKKDEDAGMSTILTTAGALALVSAAILTTVYVSRYEIGRIMRKMIIFTRSIVKSSLYRGIRCVKDL